MARDAVTITALNSDAATASPAGTTIDAANDAVIAADGYTGMLVIRITHTAASEYDATLVAPTDHPAALRSGMGDVVTAFAAGNTTPVTKYFVVESSRFAQTDGDIHVDFETGFTGTIAAMRLPDEA